MFVPMSITQGWAIGLGKALAEARIEAGFSGSQLAQILGVTRQRLFDVERERKPFPLKYLDLLPSQIRDAVKAALIEQHRREAERLEES